MKTVVITGASSGIGEASARRFAKEGWNVVIGARRIEKLQSLADEIGASPIQLDVTDANSVLAFSEQITEANVLFNNAGGAFGLEPIAVANEENWQMMFDTNVMGVLRITKALLAKIEASGDGHIINMGSTAARIVYDGGAGYTGAKHALNAFNDTLRFELMGKPIRVTEIDPGMVNTDFSTKRFDGDRERADKLYEGMTPLTADDIAECVYWCAALPSHVNIDHLQVTPVAQVINKGVAKTS